MILVLFDSYEGYFFLKKTSLNSLGLHFIYLSRVPNFWRRSWPSIYNETRQRDCGRDTKTTQRVDTSQREPESKRVVRAPARARTLHRRTPAHRGSCCSLVWHGSSELPDATATTPTRSRRSRREERCRAQEMRTRSTGSPLSKHSYLRVGEI